MSTIQSEGAQPLLGNGWKPGQIYEVCMVEGEYKARFIQRLQQAHARHLYVSDHNRFLKNLKAIQEYIDDLQYPGDLLIVDISEILYLDFIKDTDALKGNLRALYASLERLCKQGISCVVFVNYYYYYYIFHRVIRPPSVQVLIYPSQTLPFWEERLTSPPAVTELQTRQRL